MEIKVTQKHINKGRRGDVNTCAIALALAEQFGADADDVSVDPNEIKVSKKNGFSFSFEWTKIPARIQNFISKFDHDKASVKPFSFKLPVPF